MTCCAAQRAGGRMGNAAGTKPNRASAYVDTSVPTCPASRHDRTGHHRSEPVNTSETPGS